MQFEWDKEKAASNFKKHAVSFEEASSVFGDLSAKMFFDDEHSGDEIREFIIGYSETNRLLIVILQNAKINILELFPLGNRLRLNVKIMKRINNNQDDEMKSEYRFDYSKARPNRFAEEYNRMQRAVVLDSDIADKFPSAESVNEALRFLVRITEQHQTELTQK